jgi:hypothetical protein
MPISHAKEERRHWVTVRVRVSTCDKLSAWDQDSYRAHTHTSF